MKFVAGIIIAAANANTLNPGKRLLKKRFSKPIRVRNWPRTVYKQLACVYKQLALTLQPFKPSLKIQNSIHICQNGIHNFKQCFDISTQQNSSSIHMDMDAIAWIWVTDHWLVFLLVSIPSMQKTNTVSNSPDATDVWLLTLVQIALQNRPIIM